MLISVKLETIEMFKVEEGCIFSCAVPMPTGEAVALREARVQLLTPFYSPHCDPA